MVQSCFFLNQPIPRASIEQLTLNGIVRRLSSPGLSFNIIGFQVNFLIWTFFEHHSIHVHLSPLWWKQHPLKTLAFLNLEPNHEIVKSPQTFSTYVLLQGMLSSDELRGAEQAVPWSQRDSPSLPCPSLTLSTTYLLEKWIF